MNLNELKSLLSRFHIRPDKRLGQNFLLSEIALDQIIAAADIHQEDRIMEIGPGLGVLTKRLALLGGEVWAVEKDRKIHLALKKLFKNNKQVHLILGDALFFDPSAYFQLPTTYKLVANIPYYLTGQILQNFLTMRLKPTLMVLLLQKEVAERLVATPGEMSILAATVQFYAEPEIVAIVGRENFYPQPAVDSAIVRLQVRSQPLFAYPEKKFFQLIKLGFANRRKQLHNNLTAGLGGGDYKKILADLGLNSLIRAQDLSLADWAKLYQKLLS